MNKKDYEYWKSVLLLTGACEKEYEIEELLFQNHLNDYLVNKYNMNSEDGELLNYVRFGYQILRELYYCLIGEYRKIDSARSTLKFVKNPLVKEYLELIYTKGELEQMENNLEVWAKKEERAIKKKENDSYLKRKVEWISERLKEKYNEIYGEEMRQ